MYKPDILDEIIGQLDPQYIPHEYIVMAKIRTFDGNEEIVVGADLDEKLDELDDLVADVRVILDIKKIRHQIITRTNQIFSASRSI